MRNACGQHGLRHVTTAGYAQAAIIHPGTAITLGPEHLVFDGVIDNARYDRSVFLMGDGNGEMWDAMQKICRAIQRVNNPAVVSVRSLDDPLLFKQKSKGRAGVPQFIDQCLFCFQIGSRHKICRPFLRYLKLFDFTEITHHPARSLKGCVGHDSDDGGIIGHGVLCS